MPCPRYLLAVGLAAVVLAAGPASAGGPTGGTQAKPAKPRSAATASTSAGLVKSTTSTTGLPTVGPATLEAQFKDRASRLPNRLGLGVKAFPNQYGTRGWMQESEVPWDFAYQYLIGLGTTNNWTTWLGGRYVVDYAQSAAMIKAVPTFSYFQINKAAGGCGTCTNIERNLSNLATPTTSAAWFDDYRTLLQRLSRGTYDGIKGYGYGAIVHVEPDLSAYVQQAVLDPAKCPGTCAPGARGPADVRAAVAATGDPELAGFSDTYAGWNQAVIALRDRYAPNVSLGYHVSGWAGKQDVNVNTLDIDTDALADSVAAFATANGATNVPGTRRYDLVFNDIIDRDSGAYDTQFDKRDTWWDADNVRAPHFHRWERFLSRVLATTRLPGVVWQVPVGNQASLTMDNSYGHTQDNKVQYLLDHPQELRDIGVRAVLIGSGNPGSTVQWDGQKDGVTNAPVSPLCSTLGVFSRTFCWSAKSTVSDDDGGYLRLRGKQYYADGPLVLRTP